jgi:hypothetical protein
MNAQAVVNTASSVVMNAQAVVNTASSVALNTAKIAANMRWLVEFAKVNVSVKAERLA